MGSLIYLGFTIITFTISYGLMWLLTPIIFGEVFAVLDTVGLSSDWQAIYDKNQELIKWLIPLAAAMGVFILVLKAGMSASAKGRD